MTRPASGDEPAVGHGRGEHARHAARAEPDDDAPEQDQLPRLRHEHGQPGTGGAEPERDHDHAPDAEALHRRGCERAGEPEQDQVHADRERDDAAGPVQVLLQRIDEHARGGAEAAGEQQRHERDACDDPGVVQPYRPCRPWLVGHAVVRALLPLPLRHGCRAGAGRARARARSPGATPRRPRRCSARPPRPARRSPCAGRRSSRRARRRGADPPTGAGRRPRVAAPIRSRSRRTRSGRGRPARGTRGAPGCPHRSGCAAGR